jgi:hypothetical protein
MNEIRFREITSEGFQSGSKPVGVVEEGSTPRFGTTNMTDRAAVGTWTEAQEGKGRLED